MKDGPLFPARSKHNISTDRYLTHEWDNDQTTKNNKGIIKNQSFFFNKQSRNL